MADFQLALTKTLAFEGGYGHHPSDPGGATNLGISYRFLTGVGVDKYDLDKDGNMIEPAGDLNNDEKLTKEDIKLIDKTFASRVYKLFFWDTLGLDALNCQIIAEQLFDINVNSGTHRARIIFLDTIESIHEYRPKGFKEGIAFVNKLDKQQLIVLNNHICDLRLEFYRSLGKPQFMKGWTKRALGWRQ